MYEEGYDPNRGLRPLFVVMIVSGAVCMGVSFVAIRNVVRASDAVDEGLTRIGEGLDVALEEELGGLFEQGSRGFWAYAGCKNAAPDDFLSSAPATVGEVRGLRGASGADLTAAFPGVEDSAYAAWCWRNPDGDVYEAYAVGPNQAVVRYVTITRSGPPAPGYPLGIDCETAACATLEAVERAIGHDEARQRRMAELDP
jgi:hypothetical protein